MKKLTPTPTESINSIDAHPALIELLKKMLNVNIGDISFLGVKADVNREAMRAISIINAYIESGDIDQLFNKYNSYMQDYGKLTKFKPLEISNEER